MKNKSQASNETIFEWDEDEEESGYTTIENYICNNSHVQYIAQGVYLQIVRFQNSKKHKVYMSSLAETKKGSRRDIQRAILNLRMEGFIIRDFLRKDGKLSGYKYKIRKRPLELSSCEKIKICFETKINHEYTKKIYGEAYIHELLAHCEEKKITGCSNCVITKRATNNKNINTDVLIKNKNKNKRETGQSCPQSVDCFERVFSKIATRAIKEQLQEFEKYLEADLIERSFLIAKEKNKGWCYAKGIIKNWISEDIKTLSQYLTK